MPDAAPSASPRPMVVIVQGSLPVLGRATIDKARTLLQWLQWRTVEEVRETVTVLPQGLRGEGG